MSRAEPIQTSAPRSTHAADAPPAPAWRQNDFSAALRQAETRPPQRETEKQTRRAERPEDNEQAEAAGAVQPEMQGETKGPPLKAEEKTENRLEALLGSAQHQPQALVADPGAPPSAVGVVNTEFAAMLDRLALQSADTGKGLQFQFTDKSAPLSGLNVTRGADGALNVQLSAHAHSASQVNRSLGELKKRLNDRGLDVSDVGSRQEQPDAPDLAVSRRT